MNDKAYQKELDRDLPPDKDSKNPTNSVYSPPDFGQDSDPAPVLNQLAQLEYAFDEAVPNAEPSIRLPVSTYPSSSVTIPTTTITTTSAANIQYSVGINSRPVGIGSSYSPSGHYYSTSLKPSAEDRTSQKDQRRINFSDSTSTSQQASSGQDEEEEHVRRPMNAFMVWSRTERRKLALKFPNMLNCEISKMLGAEWSKMTEEEKDPYVQESKKLRSLHNLRYPDYSYRPRRRRRRNEGFSTNMHSSPSIPTTPNMYQQQSSSLLNSMQMDAGVLQSSGIMTGTSSNICSNAQSGPSMYHQMSPYSNIMAGSGLRQNTRYNPFGVSSVQQDNSSYSFTPYFDQTGQSNSLSIPSFQASANSSSSSSLTGATSSSYSSGYSTSFDSSLSGTVRQPISSIEDYLASNNRMPMASQQYRVSDIVDSQHHPQLTLHQFNSNSVSAPSEIISTTYDASANIPMTTLASYQHARSCDMTQQSATGDVSHNYSAAGQYDYNDLVNLLLSSNPSQISSEASSDLIMTMSALQGSSNVLSTLATGNSSSITSSSHIGPVTTTVSSTTSSGDSIPTTSGSDYKQFGFSNYPPR